MSLLVRRGFSLLELLIALVLLGIVTTGIYKVMVTNQRISHAQAQAVDLQQNLRTAATVLPAEFRVLDASDGDILGMSADSIRIRAMRVFGIICNPPVLGGALTGRTMTVRNALTYGSRRFTAGGDSLLLYYEGDAGSRNDDSWVPARLTATAAGTCPTDLKAGTVLTADLGAFVAPQLNQAGRISAGAPVWGFVDLTYRLFQAADGKWYLGLRDANGLAPLIGPLSGSGGLTFRYFDTAGAVTNVPASVASIEIRAVGRTAEAVRGPGGAAAPKLDSVITRVALRNNRRF